MLALAPSLPLSRSLSLPYPPCRLCRRNNATPITPTLAVALTSLLLLPIMNSPRVVIAAEEDQKDDEEDEETLRLQLERSLSELRAQALPSSTCPSPSSLSTSQPAPPTLFSFPPPLSRKGRAKNGENAFLLRVASVAKRKCDL